MKEAKESLSAENIKLKRTVNEQESENRRLTEECKELELSLNQARNELDEMRIKQKMDPSMYKTWSSDELISWICQLDDGIYVKYKEKLSVGFRDEGLNGKVIQHLDRQELRGFGVDSFSDRANIYQHIQALVSIGGNDKQNANHNDEVALAQNEGQDGTDYM